MLDMQKKPTIRPHTLQSNMPRNMQWYIFFMNSDKGYSLVYWWHLFSRMNGRLNWLCHMLSHIIILNRTTLVIESHMIQNKRKKKMETSVSKTCLKNEALTSEYHCCVTLGLFYSSLGMKYTKSVKGKQNRIRGISFSFCTFCHALPILPNCAFDDLYFGLTSCKKHSS